MEAMRNRLLAQQLETNAPAQTPVTSNDTCTPQTLSFPQTPQTPASQNVRPFVQPWRTEPRVQIMPMSPSSPAPECPTMYGTPTRMRAMRTNKSLLQSPCPRTPDRLFRTPNCGSPRKSDPSTPLERTRISQAERDKQLLSMLRGLVTTVSDVDMRKARVEGLQCLLLPHQVQGVEWMQRREKGTSKSGILADDMGLGKTVQMLALIMQHRSLANLGERPSKVSEADDADTFLEQRQSDVYASKPKTTLIVAPLAVVEQWKREAHEKTGRALRVYVHHGAGRATTPNRLLEVDVVVTTYATAANEYAAYVASKQGMKKRGTKDKPIHVGADDASNDSNPTFPFAVKKAVRSYPLYQMKWLRVVLDEAQNIKNYRAKSSQACFELSLNAAARWCLTGTPLQNNVLELFSLIHFLRLSPFDDLSHFRGQIDEPLKSTNNASVECGMNRLCVVLQTVMLRRTKDAKYKGERLLNLPTRTVEIISPEFQTDDERDFYRDLELRMAKHLQEQQGKQGANYMGVLVMLLRLRQACNHPALITGTPTSEQRSSGDKLGEPRTMQQEVSDDDELVDLLQNLSVASRHCMRCQVAMKANEEKTVCAQCEAQAQKEAKRGISWKSMPSTKLAKILALLTEIRSAKGDKAIVFSQFTSFLDLIEPNLRFHGFNFVRYDGKMSRTAREAALDAIRSRDEVTIILISFKAGSTGLNLTCCNHVILCDLWWNPQIEEQAFDRAHRLGQKKQVYVYKLSIAGTVEERILDLQEKKRALAKAALEGSRCVYEHTLTIQAIVSYVDASMN